VGQGIEVEAAGHRCQLDSTLLRPVDADGLSVELDWRCGSGARRWTVRLPVLAELSAGHTHLARASAGGAVVERVARASAPSFEVEAHPSILEEGWRFLRLGVEHIFTGYDHLAFLLALLLLGGRFTDLLKVITGFSVAHSVTLALAALNLVVLPPSLVEPAIAASIVVVAVENLWALRGGPGREDRLHQACAHRWRITLVFGLVHGFGFADALRSLHLPRAALAAGLVSFNLGVELGQLAVVAVAVPVLHALASRRGFEPRGVRVMSLGVGTLGLLWLGQRLGGVF
jgi:hydrogenase/urease accessory protein HupE